MNRTASFLVAVALTFLCSTSHAVPRTIPYVGYLTDPEGAAFTGTVDVSASLFAEADGGEAIWTAGYPSLAVTSGVLSLELADVPEPLPAEGLYLALTIDGTPLLPRQRLLSVPYALRSSDADRLGGVPADGYAMTSSLKAVCFSGTYADLVGTPDLAGFVTLADLAAVAKSGAYADLSGAPDLSGYAVASALQPVCFSGAYADLNGTPDLSGYVLLDQLAAVARSGKYADLVGLPDLSVFLRADASAVLSGDLSVSGNGGVTGTFSAGTVVAGGVDVGTELVNLRAQLWCMQNCDAARIGDCKARTCGGATQTCTPEGALADGTSCQGGAGRCKAGTCCLPATCSVLGASCGNADDGCGGTLVCGTCPDSKERCYQNACCMPKTCADLGKQCGDRDDGCGRTTGSCGTCGADDTCTAAGQCEWTGACGGVTCPVIAGYKVSCNAQAHCEYANSAPDPAGWRQYDVWIYIPAGSFTMGSPSDEAGRSPDEDPAHVVTFAKGYLIGKYELTVEQYAACQAASPATCTAPYIESWEVYDWSANSGTTRPGHPQNGLSWSQAKAACTYFAGRLPSEAEWEFAATGPVHRKYPWGSAVPSCAAGVAVYDEQGDHARPWGCESCINAGCSGTKPVGSKPAGAAWSGALDMAGNIGEWCEDWYHGSFIGAPTDGGAWTNPSGTFRMNKGGSFEANAETSRGADRGNATADSHRSMLGVRCVRSLP